MPELVSGSSISDQITNAETQPSIVSNDRLSLPFGFRAPLAVSIASMSGLCLGAAHGGQYAGLRFRAENAHRLPTSQTDWYFYHKSKNYHVMLGGLKEGGVMAARLAVWVAAFVYAEDAIDRLRDVTARRLHDFGDYRRRNENSQTTSMHLTSQRDFLSTTIAAMGVASAFSAWNRFPMPAFARMATMGLKVGLAYGLVQDALSLLRGKKLGYVEVITSRLSLHR